MDWHSTLFAWLWPGVPAGQGPAQGYEAPIHGLRGLLHTLQPEQPSGPSKGDAWHRNVAHHLRVSGVLSQHWPQALGSPMVMKGFDYATNLYPNVGLRHSNDIDILIQPGLFTLVCDELSKKMVKRARPVENRWTSERPSAVTFEHDGICIDVHRVPIMEHQTRLDLEQLFARSEGGRLGDVAVTFPSPKDRLWLWLHNFCKNSQPLALHHLVDLILIMKALSLHETDQDHWQPIVREAEALGLGLILRTALGHLNASALWCYPISESYLSDITFSVDHWVRRQQPSKWMLPIKACHQIMLTPPGHRAQVSIRLLSRVRSRVR